METKPIEAYQENPSKEIQDKACRVVVISGPNRGKTLSLKNDVVRKIGRGKGNDLPLGDECASECHLDIQQKGEDIRVRDLNSRNGTYIKRQNRQEVHIDIRKTGFKTTLRENTEIQIGITRLRFLPEFKLIGDSPAMLKVSQQIWDAAQSDETVLILGETGVGKELAAREIHRLSKRFDTKYVTCDCSSLAPGVIESELFGHEKGAFNNAICERKGLFELAEGGTVFLDEIGELPPEHQPKLLRVIQEKTVRRVGGNNVIQCDFRLIAATNRVLEDEVREKRFRPDLFYRINVLTVLIPPLRDRKEDIPVLVDHFLRGKNMEVVPEAMDKLLNHAWPGNIRELIGVLGKASCSIKGNKIEPNDISLCSTEEASSLSPLEKQEKTLLQKTLGKNGGHIGKTAKELGWSDQTVRTKIKKYRIQS